MDAIDSVYKDGVGQVSASVDYKQKLEQREKERANARGSWATVEKIKDLKQGYLSQVVHKLVQLMVEHHAIIVFEDLNFGFKRGRFKVEKQVYQKLEKMLIDKLNYLVLKEREAEMPGGLNNALQLTAPFESFQKLGKQSGFIFYVPAAYTSKVCPVTGFVDLLSPKYQCIGKSQDFFRNFDQIRYNKEQDYFEFAFRYANCAKWNNNKRNNKMAEKQLQRQWKLCSYGKRLKKQKNKDGHWESVEVDLTRELKKLMEKFGLQYQDGRELKELIYQQHEADFQKGMIGLLLLCLQMRNNRIGTEEDWIISAVEQDGGFFDSRNKAKENLPQDADANGAYHIGLKGLWMMRQLPTWEKGKKKHKGGRWKGGRIELGNLQFRMVPLCAGKALSGGLEAAGSRPFGSIAQGRSSIDGRRLYSNILVK